jgi:hypothetical protein
MGFLYFSIVGKWENEKGKRGSGEENRVVGKQNCREETFGNCIL